MDIYSEEYQKQLEADFAEEDRMREQLEAKDLQKTKATLTEAREQKEAKERGKAILAEAKTEQRKRDIARQRAAEDIAIKLRVLLQKLPPQPTTEDITPILLLATKGMGHAANDQLLYEAFTNKLDPEGKYKNIEQETPLIIK